MTPPADKPIDRILHDLQERAKELNCLYRVDELLGREDAPVDEILGELVRALPAGWQFPDVCLARLVLGQRLYEPPGFQPSPHRMASIVEAQGDIAGEVEVYYSEAMPRADEGPFLTEERKLLDAIAERVGHFVSRRRLQRVLAADGSPGSPTPEWWVVLDFLRQTDHALLGRLGRKMINHLCWNGIEEAEQLLRSTVPARTPSEEDALDDNRPQPRATAAADPETGIARYQVYRDSVLAGSTTATAFADEGLRAGTSYRYTVTAVNGHDLEGPASAPATAVTRADETPPTAPTGLAARAASSSRIDLAWSAASDPESGVLRYRIYRDGVLADSAVGTAFADTGLAAATAYTYEVAAVNGAGLEGPRSPPAGATTYVVGAGELVVIAVTGGSAIPAGYTVLVEATGFRSEQPVAPNGRVVFAGLAPRTYSVRLRTSGDCRVVEPNPRSVTVPPGGSAETTFAVTCEDDV